MQLTDKAETVNSRSELAEFINTLKRGFNNNAGSWENASLGEFLEALSAWVEDMDGYYLNNKLPVPGQPTWKMIAEMLLAAKVYE